VAEALELEEVLAALANPWRRRVIAALAADEHDEEHACGSFELPISKASRSHHFRVLREAGLVRQRDHGNGSALTLRRAEIQGQFPGLLDLVLEEPRTAG